MTTPEKALPAFPIDGLSRAREPGGASGQIQLIRDDVFTGIDTMDELREKILTLLATRERGQALETIVRYVRAANHIYTTRDDNAAEVWIYKEGIYVPAGKTYIIETCRFILGDAFTSHTANAVIDRVMADTYVDADWFFKDERPELLPIAEGILNVLTREIRPYDPDYRFFNKLPVAYEKDMGFDCPNIKKHLVTVMHREDIPVFQEAAGSCLLRDSFMETAFMLIGSGRNGKGKTLELLKTFLGPSNCSNTTMQDMDEDPYALADLHGKLANIAGDLDPRALKRTGAFKNVTGRDTVSAQRKYLNRLHFVPYAKLFFACNDLPRTLDDSYAFWKRWKVFDFSMTFVDKDEYDTLTGEEKETKRVMDKEIVGKITLPSELTGFLHWALEGLDRLRKNGSFSDSTRQRDIRTAWLRKSNSFEGFCMDMLDEDAYGYVTKAELRRKYTDYCRKHKVKPTSDAAIRGILSERFGSYDDQKTIDEAGATTRSRVWVGIIMKNEGGQ